MRATAIAIACARDFVPNFAHAFNARCLTVVSELPGRGSFILAVSILEPSKTLKLAVYELFLAADQTFQLIQKKYWIEGMGTWRRHDKEEWRNSAMGNKSPIMLAKSEGDSDTNPLICSKPKISKSRWPEIAESA